ncbi:MAG TPA: ActS/PrrB/RegB family redox-sensitive histidine kinase [Xanthobacteraceae bacterium]|nr:ActS/PrrB/RegB family redox-sensitive histidine kinase [Xanthobacteraceae bacterium]
MPSDALSYPHYPLRNVRLDTLIRLRWLAVFGQALAVLVVYDGLDFDLPVWPCLAVIGLYAWLNVALRLRFRGNQRLEPDRSAWLLAIDIAELAILLFLTGGLQNPFAFLFLGPVLISATALPVRMTLILACFAIVCATALMFVHYPLPWSNEDPLELPQPYMVGVWLALLLCIGYMSIYAWQIIEESRQLAEALAATEIVLTREQHLTQLDGLAAAAAHELGTPLSTIALVARELQKALGPNSPHAEDVKLLREQVQRCGDILGKLSQLPGPGEPFERMKLSSLIEEVVAPHRNFGVAIAIVLPAGAGAEPEVARNPAIMYGLGNIVENAIDFARERVEIAAEWTADKVTVTINDDGPGFAPEVLDRMGEPFVTGRRQRNRAASENPGLGLGFFIAKTLLERSGASLALENREFPQRGAIVRVRWGRADFERPLVGAAA